VTSERDGLAAVPRRILFSYENLLPTSQADAEVVLNTAGALARRGHEVTVAVPAPPNVSSSFEDDVLESMMRKFDTAALRTASGDVFGRIYEYFLAEFRTVHLRHPVIGDHQIELAWEILENFQSIRGILLRNHIISQSLDDFFT